MRSPFSRGAWRGPRSLQEAARTAEMDITGYYGAAILTAEANQRRAKVEELKIQTKPQSCRRERLARATWADG